MKKQQEVLYIAEDNLTITGMKLLLQEYTKNNGHYPDYIDMDMDSFWRYIHILFELPCDLTKVTFHGIKIRLKKF